MEESNLLLLKGADNYKFGLLMRVPRSVDLLVICDFLNVWVLLELNLLTYVLHQKLTCRLTLK